MSWHLVVARYNESVAWTAQHRGTWNVHIVQKDRDVPNIGREGSSYLWWIIQNYDSLKDGDRVAFAQGHPYDHCPRFDDFLRSAIMLGAVLYCDQDGWPNHPGLRSSLNRGQEIFKIPHRYEIQFVAGAQFSVTAGAIKDRPISQYEEAYQWCLEDPVAGWAIERLWMQIFKL